MKRLGEFRSKLRKLGNEKLVFVSDYEDGIPKELEIDMITENKIFFRVIEGDDNEIYRKRKSS